MSSSSCPPAGNECESVYKFFAGEDRVINIHLTEINESTGLETAFNLTNYQGAGTPNGKIELKIPGISALQTAAVLGTATDGNITFTFTAALTTQATTGVIDGVLTEKNTGKIRKFRSATKIQKIG